MSCFNSVLDISDFETEDSQADCHKVRKLTQILLIRSPANKFRGTLTGSVFDFAKYRLHED